MIDLHSYSQFFPKAYLCRFRLKRLRMREGARTHLQTPTVSRKLGSILSSRTHRPRNWPRPTSQPGEHRPGCLLTTEWNCRAGASSAGPSLGRKENQINLEQPWPRISRTARIIPSAACGGGWGARDSDSPTLRFRAPCPRDAALVLFKHALEKAASPASRQVWNRDGKGER